MNADFLRTQVMSFLQRHKGRENAIPRAGVLAHLRPFEPKVDDRKMRDIYSALPVCACPEGLFIPRTPAEVQEFRIYLEKKVGPIIAARRVKVILAYYPGLCASSMQQQNLFERRQEESEISALGLGD